MKEFKLHISNNLLSIRSFENNLSGKESFKELNKKLINKTSGLLFIQASRPNYNFSFDEFKIDELIEGNKIENLNSNEKICSYVKKDNSELLPFLTKIWFSFEHITFCYTNQSFINFDFKRKSWNEIVENVESFVIYKGIEDDVVWIGKSERLSFDFLI